MNNEEAKLILQAYRLGGQDAADPQFEGALEHVKRDPEVARWFANEHAIETLIQAKIKASVMPPPGLKERLLAQRKIARPAAWWRKPTWLAGAACLALLVAGVLFLLRPAPLTEVGGRQKSFPQYRSAMADLAGNKFSGLDFKSSDMKQIRQWLTQKNGHADLLLPAGLDGRPAMGCCVLNWSGKKVSLVCFELANQHLVHLLVVDRDALGNAPAETPEFAQAGNVATVAWSRGNKVYLLVCKGGTQEELLRLL